MIVNFETSKGKFCFCSCLMDFLGKNPKVDVLGFVNQLTEEDWKKVVDSHTYSIGTFYKDYMFNVRTNIQDEELFDWSTALASGESLLKSLEIYTENPVPRPKLTKGDIYTDSSEAYDNAQKRTANWLLIKYL